MIAQSNTPQPLIAATARPARILRYRSSQGADGYALLRDRDTSGCVLLTGRPLAPQSELFLLLESDTPQAVRVLDCQEGRSPGEFVLQLQFDRDVVFPALPEAI